jgi:hypothetical protein
VIYFRVFVLQGVELVCFKKNQVALLMQRYQPDRGVIDTAKMSLCIGAAAASAKKRAQLITIMTKKTVIIIYS